MRSVEIIYPGRTHTSGSSVVLFSNQKQKVIPGHGPLSGKDALQIQALYLEELRKEAGAAIAKGLSPEETLKAVTMEAYKDLKWSNLLVPDIIAVYQELSAEKNR